MHQDTIATEKMRRVKQLENKEQKDEEKEECEKITLLDNKT